MKKLVATVIGLILLLLLIATITPVNTTEENSVKAEMKITGIETGDSNDIVFRIKNDESLYYINRGLERNLSISELKTISEGKNAEIWYARHWSNKLFKHANRHITKLVVDDRILYQEF